MAWRMCKTQAVP